MAKQGVMNRKGIVFREYEKWKIHSLTKNICTQKKMSNSYETGHECNLARDLQMIKILTSTRQGALCAMRKRALCAKKLCSWEILKA